MAVNWNGWQRCCTVSIICAVPHCWWSLWYYTNTLIEVIEKSNKLTHTSHKIYILQYWLQSTVKNVWICEIHSSLQCFYTVKYCVLGPKTQSLTFYCRKKQYSTHYYRKNHINHHMTVESHSNNHTTGENYSNQYTTVVNIAAVFSLLQRKSLNWRLFCNTNKTLKFMVQIKVFKH